MLHLLLAAVTVSVAAPSVDQPALLGVRDVLAAGDFDGDGFDDVVASRTGDGEGEHRVTVWRGGPWGLQTGGAGWTGSGGSRALLALDSNADRYDDLVTATFDEVRLFLGSADGLSPTPVWRHALAAGAGLTQADVNDDGYDDLVVSEPSAEAQLVWTFHGGPKGLDPRPVGSDASSVAATLAEGDAPVGTFDVSGDASVKLVAANGARYAPGQDLPAGWYRVVAEFRAYGEVPLVMVQVKPGRTTNLVCAAALALCKERS